MIYHLLFLCRVSALCQVKEEDNSAAQHLPHENSRKIWDSVSNFRTLPLMFGVPRIKNSKPHFPLNAGILVYL